jgi:hypothetical protein
MLVARQWPQYAENGWPEYAENQTSRSGRQVA